MDALILLIKTYGYFILFPLAAIEGPIVSVVVGFLISLGYFSFFPAYGILILGDLIPDAVYYYIGRFGNERKLMKKYSEGKGAIANNLKLIEKLWKHHGRKTMFLSKLAYGLSTLFLITTGLIKMPFKKFISYALSVTLLQYGVLLVVGYFFGHSYQLIAGYVDYAGIFVAVILVIFVVAYILFAKYARRQIEVMEKEEKKLENK